MTRPGERTVVRAPNHLGDVIMALPGLAAAGHDVMVVRPLSPILEMAGLPVRILPLDRGFRGFWDAVARLRATGYRRGILMSASFSAALLFRVGGVRRLRGTATDGRRLLLSEPLPRASLGDRHRILQYRFLLEQPTDGPPANIRLDPPRAGIEVWREKLCGGAGNRLVGLFPGSNALSRRWPAERFSELGRRLAGDGARVVVLGGRSERSLTARVARDVPGAADLGGRTDLEALAAVLALCDVLVTNDTGPMHLAGLVGTPTVSLWGPSSSAESLPPGARNTALSGEALPCMPCKKNECPRSGPGWVLDDARKECMALISVDQVTSAARAALDDAETSGGADTGPRGQGGPGGVQ